MVVLAAVLLLLPAGTQAQQGFSITVTSSSMVTETGKQIDIEVNISNTAHATVSKPIIVVYIYPTSGTPGADYTQTPLSAMPTGNSQKFTVQFTPTKEGMHSVKVQIYNNTMVSTNFVTENTVTDVFNAKAPAKPPVEGPPMMVIIAIIVLVVIVIIVVVVVKKMKAKPKDKPLTPIYTGPVEPEKIHGKFPKDYYKFRREKLARLKPMGLTAGGTCILAAPKKEMETEQNPGDTVIKTCPKCGTPQDRNWKTCMNCSAKSVINDAMACLTKLAEAGQDIAAFEEMLKTAQTSLDAKNYDETETYAHDVLDKAKNELKRVEDAKKAAEAPAEATLAPPQHSGMLESVEPTPVGEKAYNPEASGLVPGYSEGEMKTRGHVDTAAVHEYSEASSRAQGYEPVATYEGQGSVEAVQAYGETEKTRTSEEKSPEQETPGVIKATKKEPNPCYKCGQGLRPEWKKCPYCEALQEGICPSCGKTIKMKWKVCPSCSADLTVEKPKMACLVCGTELPVSGECPACKARKLMETVSKLIKDAKVTGADLTEAEALLGRGELAIKIKNYDKALGHAQKAEEICKSAQTAFYMKKAKDKIEHAETVTKDSAEEGADIAQAEKNLVTARMMMNEKRWDEAEKWAEKAALAAEEALKAAMEQAETASMEPQPKKRPLVVGTVKVKPRCPSCQEQVEEEWTMCPYCSKPIARKCPTCGATVKSGWKVCPACEGQLSG